MHDFELGRAESGRRVGSELIEKQNKDTDAMLDQGLYQRLSEYILERDVSGSYFIYSPIASLREKIEEEPSAPQLIRTVRGFGYRFG